MAIHVALTHRTRYSYDRRIALEPQIVRLRPAPHCRTPILSYSLKVTPKQHFLNWQQDPQSNYLARLVFPERTDLFMVEVNLVAEMAIINPFDFFLEKSAETYPFAYEPSVARELRPYLETEKVGPLLADFMAKVDRRRTGTIDFLVNLNRMVQNHVGYVIRLEPGIQTCEQTLGLAMGSCRDSAWLLVQAFRHLGLAARFVSGYLIQLTSDQKSLDGPNGPEADFTDLHAWTEVYLPGAGWIGLDPTSGLLAGEGHIPLACSPDPSSAAPVSGLVEPCEVQFDHFMEVVRIDEKPRTTKPYTVLQWQDIDRLGHVVDKALAKDDVRLTMGGEPTFVSVDDVDGDEWNIAAVGPTKRLLGGRLIEKLTKRFAPGGLLHFGQGKWYPGEPLPRWALTVYWRRDGEKIWLDPALLGREDQEYGHGVAEAERFAEALTARLGFDRSVISPAYEDDWFYADREAKLPVNVVPADSKSDNKQERDRLAAVFKRGVETAVGYVLPIGKAERADARIWRSSLWPMRGRLKLVSGDSAMGFRLPLASLPWVEPADYPYLVVQDPFAPREPLPKRGKLSSSAKPSETDLTVPEPGQSAKWIVRTALCVEPRDGRLYVFMPPLERLEDYLELVVALEETAKETGLPIILEGYQPPRDPRLNSLAVTPDPGVIEVNIHPAANWDELTKNTIGLYEDAFASRLRTEKFMIDGRHVGTGGGNHVVVGGQTPTDSPFLRRPDLLRSLITYWQNHPALSYLFAGLFIGPTSQAPRVDEGRDEKLYELEIAFREIDKAGEGAPPWMIDRTLRHLLTDIQGNTHRAEFCIDKLFSPDSATGRLGLVEFRGFEMPPHAEMSLTQQLLLRALIARFWHAPYKNRLIRWGTELHDRFMLPFFVEQDIGDVADDMAASGFNFAKSWFEPHLNFRFPVHGFVELRGMKLELRHALEPWHVLGEEPTAGGTVRFVDSTVERLQVLVTGVVDDRHVVTCNGWQVPLRGTGREGEKVAGVRFRAWQLASALHPTIPPHAPLVFDLVDRWSGRSLGGCTYHVSHPGGRNFESFPVNAHEAEGRRLARFQTVGHTAGAIELGEAPVNPDYPMTLDLRRV
jgi:uncharacterized protein (DUF2126 family)/transglutaminase-like putative cysteine protease